MEKVTVPANASRLINAIAKIGYDPEVALCDMMDNSIDAKATRLIVDIQKAVSETGESDAIRQYAIVDDGCGMDKEDLITAFSLGSIREYPPHTLGKFGLGLKSAGLSLGDTICILSKTQKMDGPLCAVLRIAEIGAEYQIAIGNPEDDDLEIWHKYCDDFVSGTIVLIRGLNDNQPSYTRFIPYFQRYCSVIYHMFIEPSEKSVSIEINNTQLPPIDPLFLEVARKNGSLANPEDWDGKSIRLLIDDQELPLSEGVNCKIAATHLVHPPSFGEDRRETQEKFLIARDPDTRRERHGFYIYRNRRVIVLAERFHGLIPAQFQASAFRGRLMFDETADEILSLDVKKIHCQLPQKARSNLQSMITNYSTSSAVAWRAAGRRVSQVVRSSKEDLANQSIANTPIPNLDYMPGEEITDAAGISSRKTVLSEIRETTLGAIQDDAVTEETLRERAKDKITVIPSKGLRANAMWLAYPATEVGMAQTLINEAHSWISEAYAAAEEEPRITIILHQLFTILAPRSELEILSMPSIPGMTRDQVKRIMDRFKSRASMIGEDLADALKRQMEEVSGESEDEDGE